MRDVVTIEAYPRSVIFLDTKDAQIVGLTRNIHRGTGQHDDAVTDRHETLVAQVRVNPAVQLLRILKHRGNDGVSAPDPGEGLGRGLIRGENDERGARTQTSDTTGRCHRTW